MARINRFIVDHHIIVNGDGSNELLVLEPITDKIIGTILFLHGHQIGARIGAWETPRYLGPLLAQGYRIIAPSILGYGKTIGNPDYCGPDTLQRLRITIENFVDEPIHVIGASRGGTLAILFAEHYPELTRSSTAIAGVYDLESLVDQTPDEIVKQNIIFETGGTRSAFTIRDPKTLWKNLKAPLHIIHGSEDKQIPIEQAKSFVDFLQSNGVKPELTIIEGGKHKLFSEQFFNDEIVPFIINK